MSKDASVEDSIHVNIQKSFKEGHDCGTLYLVATPIGNLEDITYRAVRTLREVQWIAAEDTRQTRKLLTHFQIGTRLISYHEHNKQASGPELVRLLRHGDSIALVSDAGMPAISDPGYDLVKLAIEAEIPIVPIPGANAALSALIASGLPTSGFRFVGFLPRENKVIQTVLEQLRQEPSTLLFYESPHRVIKSLEKIREAWGDRPICLARELTKKFEEFLRGSITECLAYLETHTPQGEYCIVVGGSTDAGIQDQWWEELTLEQHVERYVTQGLNKKEATKQTAEDRGIPKREVYNALL